MAAAKWPTHYFATNTHSGASRSVFFILYDFFEAWQKDTRAIYGATLAALDRAFIADGELLGSVENNVFHWREDLSYNADKVNVGRSCYFGARAVRIKRGHQMEGAVDLEIQIDNA